MGEITKQYREEIERTIQRALEDSLGNGPPKLKRAMRYAVFPPGGRVRPQLCLAVASASGEKPMALSFAAAAAVELIHAASLVHDDLPSFDNAETRRGKPSVHRAFDEPTAILVGDGLIAAAFEVLSRAETVFFSRTVELVRMLSQAMGPSRGLVAGQALESEGGTVSAVHSAKTGALFRAAAAMGAVSMGDDETSWCDVGQHIGLAYQLADDLFDATGNAALGGKAVGRDAILLRPNALRDSSFENVLGQLGSQLKLAAKSIPECPGRTALTALIGKIGSRLCPAACFDVIMGRSGQFFDINSERHDPLRIETTSEKVSVAR